MFALQQGATAAGEGGEQPPLQQRRWKDWVLERETELRIEVPDQDGSPVDIKVVLASLLSVPDV